MQAIQVSGIDAWFPETEVEPFPYTKTFAQGEWEPLVVLHTSGSTGLPKPIVVTQGAMAVSDRFHAFAEWEGHTIALRTWAESCRRMLCPMPLFHMAGLICVVSLSFYWDTPVVLGIHSRPLTSELVMDMVAHADIQSILLPPALVEDLSQTDEGTKTLASLRLVSFGGGNLAREAGHRLVSRGVTLHNLIGSTEWAPFPSYTPKDPYDWQYFIYNPETFGCEFRRQEGGEDNVYELVVVRQKQPDNHPGMQGIWYTFPELTEWSTRDLYRPHATKPHHWIYHGRADNIIVFSNGEKLNPVTIEEIVTDHPALKGALVVGTQRFQAGLIVEPAGAYPATEDQRRALLDSVWPLVEKANAETVAHGRIARDMLVLSHPDKPFLRAGKGTIQRALTVKLYEDDINRMYENRSGSGNENGEEEAAAAAAANKLDVSSEEALTQSLVETLRKNLGADRLDTDVDFFAAGIDSLGVMNAAKVIRAGLQRSGHAVADPQVVAPRVIYRNSTPRRLAAYLFQHVLNDGSSGSGAGGAKLGEEEQQQQQAMTTLYHKYTAHRTVAKPHRPAPRTAGQVVVLTGSTGMLGSYLLAQLGANPAVAKILCLNRAADGGRAQQETALASRGLDVNLVHTKAEFFHVDTARADLGLAPQVYARLQAETDRIIHNAWPVNFNLPIESFEPFLASCRHLADLAATAARRVALTFISSIATAERWHPVRNGRPTIPETRFEDMSLPALGYGRSKMVGSLIIEDCAAPDAGDFPYAIVRVGQVAGPEADKGMWNRQEWLPSIIASSLYLGALPGDLGGMGRVDWTPAERIATLVLEASGVAPTRRIPVSASSVADLADINGYYHGVNPHETDWPTLAAAVQAFYGPERIAELVPFHEWIDRLERTQADGEATVARNPGVKLIDSYRGMARSPPTAPYDMTETARRCPSVRAWGPLTPALMQHWCKQWGF